MIWPLLISRCTSTIESAGYENRMSGAVRGRELATPSYSIFFYNRFSKFPSTEHPSVKIINAFGSIL